MNKRTRIAITCFAMLTVALLPFNPVEAKKPPGPGGGGGGGGTTAPYSLVDLGGFTGGDFVQAWARDVNNPDASGLIQVVGDSFVPIPGLRDPHAALWDITTDGQILALSDLHPAGFQTSTADEVNDLGFAIVNHTVVHLPGVGLLNVPGLGSGNGSPIWLDNFGNVFGTAMDPDGIEHFVVWQIDPQGQIMGPFDFGDLSIFGDFVPRDININGMMAGYVNPDAAIAWFDEDGQLQVQILGALGPNDIAHAVAVNDFGMVTGNSRDAGGFWEAFVWTPETGMVGLGKLGLPDSRATDINNQGQVVGWTDSEGRFGQVGFLWHHGQMFDLNSISVGAGGKNWIQIASGINDAGHIVGLLHKTKPISEDHGFLLVPTSGN